MMLVMTLVAMGGAQAALTINSDGTVTDPTTGLTWMRCAMGQILNGSTCTGTVATYTFDQANALTGTVTFAGQSDWRMPNIRELQTIVDRSVYGPAIDSSAFPDTPGSYFWSGSPYADYSDYAWLVYFGYGYAYYSYRSDAFAVRLVRGGQSFAPLLGITRPTSDYVDNGNGTVMHTPTKLTWKRCAQGQTWTGSTCNGTASTFTFDQAQTLAGTTFAGQNDWRVPTEDELVSLVDYSIASTPVINSSVFPETPASGFWSGSPSASYSGFAWSVSFGNGSAYGNGYRSSNGAVRLVRGGQSLGPFVLTVSKSGAGVGTINSSPAGISCGSTCSASFASGAGVALTATPATGSTFTGWSGACTGTGGCSVSMTAAQSVTATFTQSVATAAPICTLSASTSTINPGSSSTLTATCNPAAASHVWTGGTCAGTTGTACTVTPSAATSYTVTGVNTSGTGNTASAVVRIASNASSTVPGTQDNDFFLPSGNNSYYGGAGNDTYIISPYTLSGAVTVKIIDTEGSDVIQFVSGMTIVSSSFFMDAAQFMLSNGAIVQVLGASRFIYQLGVNILAGETASNLSYAQFAATLGASIPTGSTPVSGTANFVVTNSAVLP